jgi:hypothetical protein
MAIAGSSASADRTGRGSNIIVISPRRPQIVARRKERLAAVESDGAMMTILIHPSPPPTMPIRITRPRRRSVSPAHATDPHSPVHDADPYLPLTTLIGIPPPVMPIRIAHPTMPIRISRSRG